MDNYEKLRESKLIYEYINDLLENGNFEIPEEDEYSLNATMGIMANIYINTHIMMKDDKEEIELLKTDLSCPCCFENLMISDLISYGYVCEKCDEKYYLCEGDLNYEWYFKDKYKNKLKEDVLLEISYDKNTNNVIIGTDTSSGVKYECKNVSDLASSVECYAKSYLTYDDKETYFIKIWKTAKDKEQEIFLKYFDTYNDKNEAIKETKKLIKTNGYNFVEVVRDNSKSIVFSSDGENEKTSFYHRYNNRIFKVSREELDQYIDNWKNKKEQRYDFDLLYCENKNGTYIAVDNYDGGCYVEEFETEAQAVFWLNTNVPAEEIKFNIISKDIIEKVYVIDLEEEKEFVV